jgi:ABC-type antimicrobial peptide transport system permease subunit
MDERLAAALSPQRFQLILVGCFAFIAALLAAAGVYGVMSYLVARRGREIGIRMALGARSADVLRLVAMESVGLSFIAIAAGLAGAWALTWYVKSILYGIAPLDAPSFVLSPVVLWAAVLAATIGPARRAAKVDPIRSLREE